MRKLLDFFQDSIGYFHSETIALLQTFATGLLNNESYAESAVRFQQLVDAFETTQGKQCYEVCYALRRTSEAYFYNGKYAESLQAIKAVLERSKSLPHLEEREMYVRCLRALAEISGKLNRREEAIDTMRHMLDTTIEAFGEHHTFVCSSENATKVHSERRKRDGRCDTSNGAHAGSWRQRFAMGLDNRVQSYKTHSMSSSSPTHTLFGLASTSADLQADRNTCGLQATISHGRSPLVSNERLLYCIQ